MASLHETIKACWDCRHMCQQMLYTYCLQEGGAHVQPEHVKAMTDCIQICQVTADFLTRESQASHTICAACAGICELCAGSCDEIGMAHCAQACMNCAAACREIMHMKKAA